MRRFDPLARRFGRTANDHLRPLRLALLLVAILGGVAPLAGALPVAAENTARVGGTSGAGVRLRDLPGLEGGIVLVVPEGATLALLGATRQADDREWAQVRYGNARGWVASSFLRPGVAAAAAPVAAAPAAEAVVAAGRLTVGGQAVVTGTGGASLRIRADASLDAPVLGYAPFGGTVAIIAGPRGDWYGVRLGGIEGWASGRFLAPAGASAPPTAPPAAPTSAAPGGGSGALVTAALRFLGVPYVWGGASPAGWDCSGFVVYLYREMTGRTLPRTTQAQWGVGTPVVRDAIRAGDLVFFQNTYAPGITHVGIALGDGRFVHARSPRHGTVISSLSDPYYASRYAGARRL